MDQLKLILFDLGNVVIPYSLDLTVNYWSTLTGFSPDKLRNLVSFDNEVYFSFERGEIPPSRFRKYMSELIQFPFSEHEFDSGWNAMFLDISETIHSILEKLKQHFLLAALSNTNEIHEKYFMPKYAATMALFDKLFFSYKLHVRKPEKEAFQSVMDYFKTAPDEVLFFDDKDINVKAAEEMGIKSFLAFSYEDILNGLNKSGVNI